MTTETPAADIVMLSGICGKHHVEDCQSCQNARLWSDREIRRLHGEIARLRAENAELRADRDALYQSYMEMKGAADDLQRKLDEAVEIASYLDRAYAVEAQGVEDTFLTVNENSKVFSVSSARQRLTSIRGEA